MSDFQNIVSGITLNLMVKSNSKEKNFDMFYDIFVKSKSAEDLKFMFDAFGLGELGDGHIRKDELIKYTLFTIYQLYRSGIISIDKVPDGFINASDCIKHYINICHMRQTHIVRLQKEIRELQSIIQLREQYIKKSDKTFQQLLTYQKKIEQNVKVSQGLINIMNSN